MTLYQNLKKISQELITKKSIVEKPINPKYKIEKYNYKDCYMFQIFEDSVCLHCEVQYDEKMASDFADKWLKAYKKRKE